MLPALASDYYPRSRPWVPWDLTEEEVDDRLEYESFGAGHPRR